LRNKRYTRVSLLRKEASEGAIYNHIRINGLMYVNLEDMESRSFTIEDPKGFLREYSRGAVIDEFQNAPDLVSHIQVQVDEKKKNGLFCLTGSRQFEVFDRISRCPSLE
jgi:predicted AAA+ superfamily ATPase